MSQLKDAPDRSPVWDAQAAQRSAPLEPLGAISSEALLRGQPSISIHHQGAIYRLQTTRQGKLILTK